MTYNQFIIHSSNHIYISQIGSSKILKKKIWGNGFTKSELTMNVQGIFKGQNN